MTTPLSDERIAELRERYAAPQHMDNSLEAVYGYCVDTERLGRFARTDVPDLLAEVERLRAALEAALEAAKPKRPNYGPTKAWTYEGPPPETWLVDKEATNDDATE